MRSLRHYRPQEPLTASKPVDKPRMCHMLRNQDLQVILVVIGIIGLMLSFGQLILKLVELLK